MTDTSDAMMKK